MFQTCTCSNFSGRDKRAYIAVLRQAKIYPPRQAEAAADRGVVQLVHCGGSCIAAATFKFVAAAMHDQRLPQLLGWVDFSLPQGRNIGPFIPSHFLAAC